MNHNFDLFQHFVKDRGFPLIVNLTHISEMLGVAQKTIINTRVVDKNCYPFIRKNGRNLQADIRDVIAFLNAQRHYKDQENKDD